ncbi:GYDIA family GHMP kinase [Neolewinella persica]|uniref:GYDIA family GHMP kinase n=1 Tax=Neolewinella persica TaxID=70998 RepID=UPI00037BF4AD|nr:GYDIA family GHMP kinase [Neolewinella persica]
MTHLRANGKLLLTAEYFVLDGVPALAVPTRAGQRMTASPTKPEAEHDLYWRAYDAAGEGWFSHAFDRHEWSGPSHQTKEQKEDTATRIVQILRAAETLRPGCTSHINGLEVTTYLEFDQAWGLGSSSTLIAMVADWLEVNPYALLEKTFGGSGYDLACAVAAGPILYERNGITPKVTELDWNPAWTSQTYFVYRNQKQNSREGIRAYREQTVSSSVKEEISGITTALLSPTLHLRAAAQLLHRHEAIVAQTLGLPTVQDELFTDFPGQLKSLGAWGGDFIWALSEESEEKVRRYFNERGYETVISYNNMVL